MSTPCKLALVAAVAIHLVFAFICIQFWMNWSWFWSLPTSEIVAWVIAVCLLNSTRRLLYYYALVEEWNWAVLLT